VFIIALLGIVKKEKPKGEKTKQKKKKRMMISQQTLNEENHTLSRDPDLVALNDTREKQSNH
jgi:hypothetical protein